MSDRSGYSVGMDNHLCSCGRCRGPEKVAGRRDRSRDFEGSRGVSRSEEGEVPSLRHTRDRSRSTSPDRRQHGRYNDKVNRSAVRVRTARQAATGTTKVVFFNLDYQVSSSDIRQLCDTYWPLQDAAVNFHEDGSSKGSAYVIFDRKCDALSAIRKYNGLELDGRAMRVRLWVQPSQRGNSRPGSVPFNWDRLGPRPKAQRNLSRGGRGRDRGRVQGSVRGQARGSEGMAVEVRGSEEMDVKARGSEEMAVEVRQQMYTESSMDAGHVRRKVLEQESTAVVRHDSQSKPVLSEELLDAELPKHVYKEDTEVDRTEPEHLVETMSNCSYGSL